MLLSADVTATSQVVSRTLAGAEPSTLDPLVSQGAAATAAVPWTALAILAVIALLVAWRVIAARRRRAAHAREIAAAVAAARADADGTDAAVPGAATGAAAEREPVPAGGVADTEGVPEAPSPAPTRASRRSP